MQPSNKPSALFLLAGMPDHQGALRAGIGRFAFIFRRILDAQPGQDGGEHQVPDEDNQCHFGPRKTEIYARFRHLPAPATLLIIKNRVADKC